MFSILPDCDRFYATETLFGDWNATTLLLAKDAAPTDAIRSLAELEACGAWRHSQRSRGDTGGWRTNERLVKLVEPVPGAKLYGSATANMLCDLPGWSRNLPDFWKPGPLHDYLAEALGWVIDHMPNLRAIACMGREAWYLTTVVLGRREFAKAYAACRDGEQLVMGTRGERSILASCHYHPGARVGNDRIGLGWQRVAEALGDCGVRVAA